MSHIVQIPFMTAENNQILMEPGIEHIEFQFMGDLFSELAAGRKRIRFTMTPKNQPPTVTYISPGFNTVHIGHFQPGEHVAFHVDIENVIADGQDGGDASSSSGEIIVQ